MKADINIGGPFGGQGSAAAIQFCNMVEGGAPERLDKSKDPEDSSIDITDYPWIAIAPVKQATE